MGVPTRGCTGTVGPNDYGYMVGHVRRAAEHLVRASDLYSEGHYAHSNAREMPMDHPIAVALAALAKFDQEFSQWNNAEHDPELFKPHQPTEAAKHRWDKPAGPVGEQQAV